MSTRAHHQFIVEGDGGRKAVTIDLYALPTLAPQRLHGIAKKQAARQLSTPANALSVTGHERLADVEREVHSAPAPKPVVRRVRDVDAPHGVNENFAVTLYPNGVIGIRESKRSVASEITFRVGELYARGVAARVRAMRLEKKKARKAAR